MSCHSLSYLFGLSVSCLQSLQDGSAKYDFIEVMACPGGCIGGGGQPRSADKQILAVSAAGCRVQLLH